MLWKISQEQLSTFMKDLPARLSPIVDEETLEHTETADWCHLMSPWGEPADCLYYSSVNLDAQVRDMRETYKVSIAERDRLAQFLGRILLQQSC